MTKKLAIWEATLAKPRLISSMIPSSSSRATTATAAGACEMGRGIGGNSEESGAHNDTVGDGGADRPPPFSHDKCIGHFTRFNNDFASSILVCLLISVCFLNSIPLKWSP